MDFSLTEPQEEFVFTDAKNPAMVAGLGCLHPDTLIRTEYGLMRMRDVSYGVRVLSWNQTDQLFQLSPCSGSFPKGKETLYRVTTSQGEFVAAGHHRVFSSENNYSRVEDLRVGDYLNSSYFSRLGSSWDIKILNVSLEEQEEYYYDMQVPGNNNYVCESGIIHHNSGKTHASICRLLYKMLEKKGTDTAYYMPTYDLLKLRVLPGVEQELKNLGLSFRTNKSDYIIDVFGYGKMILRSFDNPARIIAYEVSHSIVDELDTLPKDKAEYVFRKVSERNRQKEQGSIGVATTPDHGINGFVYHKWVKVRGDGYIVIKAPTSSNPLLPEDYEESIRSNYDPILADMYINGEFVSLTHNKVYHFFDRQKHCSDRELLDSDKTIEIGIDFNIGGCCSTVWVVQDNIPTAVHEFVSHDTHDFCNRLVQFGKRKINVYPDASGSARTTNATHTDISKIASAGCIVHVDRSNPAVRDRINSVNSLLAHDRIRINVDKCPELTGALEAQGYTKKGDPEKFDDHPAIDDWADQAGYFINKKFPISRLTRYKNIGSAS